MAPRRSQAAVALPEMRRQSATRKQDETEEGETTMKHRRRRFQRARKQARIELERMGASLRGIAAVGMTRLRREGGLLLGQAQIVIGPGESVVFRATEDGAWKPEALPSEAAGDSFTLCEPVCIGTNPDGFVFMPRPTDVKGPATTPPTKPFVGPRASRKQRGLKR
jgi:hypothetical protein